MAGTSIFTIQSVETWRLKLSERIAWKLGEETRIRADWFLSHPAGPLPHDPPTLQVKFEEAQTGAFRGFYRAHLTSRMITYNIAWLLREIADYHGGYAGARHSGFLDGLQKASLRLLKTIPDTQDRRKVYEAAAKAAKDGRVRGLIAADMREMDKEAKVVVKDMHTNARKSTGKAA